MSDSGKAVFLRYASQDAEAAKLHVVSVERSGLDVERSAPRGAV